MTTNKMSKIFLLLVLSTLASSQELADPFLPRNLEERIINCHGKMSVCVSPVMYKYCIRDANGQSVAIGNNIQCDKNMRCVNDGVDICVPLKTSTEAPQIQTILSTISSTAVPGPSTESPMLANSSIITPSTSSSIVTGKINTGTPVEATRVVVKATPTLVEATNAPVETTVTAGLPQVNTVATVAEMSAIEESTILPNNQGAPKETTEASVNFYDITTTENAESSFNIITTMVAAEQNSLVDATEPNELQISNTSDATTSTPIEPSALPVEPVNTLNNPVLIPVNSGKPLVPVAPFKNTSSHLTVEAISTPVDISSRQTTINLPSDPAIHKDRTTVPVVQSSTPTIFISEASTTVSADKNIPEEQSLKSVNPEALDKLNISSVSKIPSTSAPESTNSNLPVTSTSLPQDIINEGDIISVTSGLTPELEPSTQSNTISPLDSTTEPFSVSNVSFSLRKNPKIPFDSSVLAGTSVAPTELNRPSDPIAEVDTTPSIPQKPVLSTIESHSQTDSSAAVTSAPPNIVTATNPNITVGSEAEVNLNVKPNNLEGTSSPLDHTSFSNASEPNVPLALNASASSGVNQKAAADSNGPITTNIEIDSSVTASQNNQFAINIPNTNSTIATSGNSNPSTNPTTSTELSSPAQPSTDQNMLENTNVSGDASISLNENALVNSNTAVNTHAPVNPNTVNSNSLISTSDAAVANSSGVVSNVPTKLSGVPSLLDIPSIVASTPPGPNASANAGVNPNTIADSDLPLTTDISINSSAAAVKENKVAVNIPNTTNTLASGNQNVAESSNVPSEPSANPSTADVPSIVSNPGVLPGPNTSVSAGATPNAIADSHTPLATNVAFDSSASAVQNNKVAINIPSASGTLGTTVKSVSPTTAAQQSSSAQISPNEIVLGNTDARGNASVSKDPSASANSNALVNTHTTVNPNTENSSSPTSTSGATEANNSTVSSSVLSEQNVNPSTSDVPSIVSNPGVPSGTSPLVGAAATPSAIANSDPPLATNIAIDFSASAVQNNKVAINIPNASGTLGTYVNPVPPADSTSADQPSSSAQISTDRNIVGNTDATVPLDPNASANSNAPVNTHTPVNPNAVNSPTSTSGTAVPVSSNVPIKQNSVPSTSDIPSIGLDPSVALDSNTSVSPGVNPNTVADTNVPLATDLAINSSASAVQNSNTVVNILNGSNTSGLRVNQIGAADPNSTAKPISPNKPLADPSAFGNPSIPNVSVLLNPSASVSSITSVNTNADLNPNSLNSGSSISTSTASEAHNSVVSSSTTSKSNAIPSKSDIPSTPPNSNAPGVNANATVDADAQPSSKLAINSNAASDQNILIDSSAQGTLNVGKTHNSPIDPIASTQPTANSPSLRDPNVANGAGVLLNHNTSVSSNILVNTNEPANPNAVNISSSGILNSQSDLVSSAYPNELLTPSVSTGIVEENSGSVPNTADKTTSLVNTSSNSYTPIVPILPTDSNVPSESNSNLAHDFNKPKKPESQEVESAESEEKPDSNENSSKEDKSKEENDKKNKKKKKEEEDKKMKEEEKKKRKEEERKRKDEKKKLKEEKRKNKNKKEDKNNSGSSEDSDEDVLKQQKEEKKQFIKRIMKYMKKNECDDDEVLPDVKDCNKYYRCVENYDNTQFVHMHCEGGKLYDFEEEQCVNESQAHCLLKEE